MDMIAANPLISDLLYVQNQVNRPTFEPQELEAIALRTAIARRKLLDFIELKKTRPGLSPSELKIIFSRRHRTGGK